MSIRAYQVTKDSKGAQWALPSQTPPCPALLWELGGGTLGKVTGKEKCCKESQRKVSFWDTSNGRLEQILITCKKNWRDGQSKTRGPAWIPSRVLHTRVMMIHCLVFTLFPSFSTWMFLNFGKALPVLSLNVNFKVFNLATLLAMTQTPENLTHNFSLYI